MANALLEILKRSRRPKPVDPYSLDANNARANEAMSSAGAAGSAANTGYINRLNTFDPSASIEKYAKSAWDTAVNDPVSGLKRSLADLRGSAVSGGRLDTGFFDQDQGDVINNATKGYQNTVGRLAVEGTRMGMENTESIGRFGQNQQNQYLDLLTAQREQQINDAREKAERQRRKKRGIGSLIGGAIGGVGGFLLGGPQGAISGYGLGSQVGGGF